ncbi:TylF/MycF/NovP-related O-methyltransferase [Janthinobacterium sp.]|uniref:O-linked N-acetylglucosamine transferase family protein n=1 Tax=Janthinobacterium sp. TaxID=1871054 RepID=UPI00293D654B|nr:TylF/MycF/NovP-related O-methyltransferase [Janthinobacterium sp.]
MKKNPARHQPDPLQTLRLALAGNQMAAAPALAATLARRGALPIVELFSVCQLHIQAARTADAVALYRLWLEHTVSEVAYAVLFNLAVSLGNQNDDAGAEESYRRALALKPDFIEAHLNLGTLLERRGLPVEALTLWNRVTALARPEVAGERDFYLQALNNLGRLLEIRKQLPEANDVLVKSLQVDPQQPKVLTHVIHLRQKLCQWPLYQPIAGVSEQQMIEATSALASLSADTDPAEQLAASRRFVAEKVMPATAPLAPPQGYRHERLRVGYLSSDLCSHAVSILTAELYELHDRSSVEVYAFSWSREDGTPLRSRVVSAMDHYIRIDGMDDEAAARCILAHEIDILVDLHGLTLGTRPNILSWRPAPVQMTYLGFPGPTALPCIDYVIADAFVLPPELAPYFTERPLYMPRSFQINDRQRAIGARPTRASCGLPEDAFVFCSFNNNFKFTEEVFASWMRILARAPASVLWLVSDHEMVRQNLRAAAAAHDIDPARLLFAERVTPADYLARYQVADLFLDTMPFNAGTTASDALWAGLPLLTCSGRTFSSRMAGSLLLAVDLPELVTHSLQEYEDKAVGLALQPRRVAEMKQQLQEQRLSCALFDSPRFVRDLEDLFRSVALSPDRAALPMAPSAPPFAPPAAKEHSMKLPAHTPIADPSRIMNFMVQTVWGLTDPARFYALMEEAKALVVPGTYLGDNLFTWGKNNSPFEDQAFVRAWEANVQNDADRAIAWRRYILACSAYHCSQLEGDFVECGVYRGTGIKTVIDYFGKDEFSKTFWGYDTYDYNPVEGHKFVGQEDGMYEQIQQRFAGYDNVRLVKGLLPASLEGNSPQKIAYLHIDLNNAAFEIAVLDALFERVVPGGMVILDDYEWAGEYRVQKIAEDAWFEARKYRVFPLPTGQGLVLKR